MSTIELMSCIAIILIVSALLYPILASSKRSAKLSHSILALKNIYSALSMYREQQGSVSAYGNLYSMGLPTFDMVRTTGVGLTQEAWQSPCGHPDRETFKALPPAKRPNFLIEYDYMANDSLTWEYYTLNEGDNAVLAAELNCDEHRLEFRFSPYRNYHAIGIFLGGHAKTVIRPGDPHDATFWCTVPRCVAPPPGMRKG
ncbi:MAG TPA: type II secretion system protein [Fimbriimonadaceae bacterium]|nr:type II secretion system protein [Fimbriimonadaceae bacterium]